MKVMKNRSEAELVSSLQSGKRMNEAIKNHLLGLFRKAQLVRYEQPRHPAGCGRYFPGGGKFY
jgi:hypothetical protein